MDEEKCVWYLCHRSYRNGYENDAIRKIFQILVAKQTRAYRLATSVLCLEYPGKTTRPHISSWYRSCWTTICEFAGARTRLDQNQSHISSRIELRGSFQNGAQKILLLRVHDCSIEKNEIDRGKEYCGRSRSAR